MLRLPTAKTNAGQLAPCRVYAGAKSIHPADSPESQGDRHSRAQHFRWNPKTLTKQSHDSSVLPNDTWMARYCLHSTLRRHSSGRYLANTMPDLERTLQSCRMVTQSAMLPNSRTGMRWGRALGKLRACKSHSSRRKLRGGGGGKSALRGQSRDRKVLLKTPTTARSGLICRRVRGLWH